MNNETTATAVHICKLCGEDKLSLVKKSELNGNLSSKNFCITDSHYGETLDLFKCASCGFLQSIDTGNIKQYYENLEDPEYENTREERGIQAQKIMRSASKFVPNGSLMDVGAGSGILVEQAQKMGYNAVGIEPSVWLQQKALARNLPVLLGVLNSDEARSMFDIVTVVDVIEHVDDPVGLLVNVRNIMKDDAIMVLTTPDVDSILAKILGWKWWHFRVAHINYFNLRTIKLLLEKSGFEIIKNKRPNWYFTLDYLFTRVKQYLPDFLRFSNPKFLKNITIPLNLFDSYEIICRKKI
jgi:SAM-dependent methyltransferase